MAESEYETIVIPKGTLLFRGIHNVATLTSDFAGIAKKDGFCLHQNFNVFFFPFPFVSNTVENYEYVVMYVTMRDLKLVNLILPSKFSRADKHLKKGGILDCMALGPKCGRGGRVYDPCVDYTKVSQDVSGMLGIAGVDANSLRFSKAIFQKWLNKYFTTYKDSRNAVGVPEFVLQPKPVNTEERTANINDFEAWYGSNKDSFNYNYIHVMPYDTTSIQKLMDEFLSQDGLDLGDDTPYHLKLNKKTGFFQIDEFSNNQSELISPTADLIPGTEMVLKHKNIYKKIKADKYPKADKIPAVLTVFDTQYNDDIKLDPDTDAFVKLYYFQDDEVMRSGRVLQENGQYTSFTNIFIIDGKYYAILLTPRGQEILENARRTHDPAFISSPTGVKNHPINNEVSAYEVISTGPSTYKITRVASEINGLLQYYAKKKGLLSGSSRRRTRRLFRR